MTIASWVRGSYIQLISYNLEVSANGLGPGGLDIRDACRKRDWVSILCWFSWLNTTNLNSWLEADASKIQPKKLVKLGCFHIWTTWSGPFQRPVFYPRRLAAEAAQQLDIWWNVGESQLTPGWIHEDQPPLLADRYFPGDMGKMYINGQT